MPHFFKSMSLDQHSIPQPGLPLGFLLSRAISVRVMHLSRFPPARACWSPLCVMLVVMLWRSELHIAKDLKVQAALKLKKHTRVYHTIRYTIKDVAFPRFKKALVGTRRSLVVRHNRDLL